MEMISGRVLELLGMVLDVQKKTGVDEHFIYLAYTEPAHLQCDAIPQTLGTFLIYRIILHLPLKLPPLLHRFVVFLSFCIF